ncbi:MAG: hypothetical protein CL933_09625 [Deltaproteobacteria bacterium]|nr:hypothetical protein [Deltaproteobacteria bacterium]
MRASGRGTVHTCSIIHQASRPELADRVPYNVVVIEPEEGPSSTRISSSARIMRSTSACPSRSSSRICPTRSRCRSSGVEGRKNPMKTGMGDDTPPELFSATPRPKITFDG